MLRRNLLGALVFALVGTVSAQEIEPSFMDFVREVSSAVPPLRLREQPTTRILVGRFDNDRRLDALVLSEYGTAFCKGPDYKRCVPITEIPATRTIAVNSGGNRTVLLQYEGAYGGQVCTVNTAGFRTALDCRTLDRARLGEYNATSLAEGKVLMVDGVDGKYFCSEASGSARCSLIATPDGQKPEKRTGKRAEVLPPDQPGRICTFTAQGFDCTDQKLGGAFMQHALLYYDYDYMNDFSAFQNFTMGEVNFGCGMGVCGDVGWWGPIEFAAQNVRKNRQQCFTQCEEIHGFLGDVCDISALLGLTFGPAVAATQWIVCMGVRGGVHLTCKGNC